MLLCLFDITVHVWCYCSRHSPKRVRFMVKWADLNFGNCACLSPILCYLQHLPLPMCIGVYHLPGNYSPSVECALTVPVQYSLTICVAFTRNETGTFIDSTLWTLLRTYVYICITLAHSQSHYTSNCCSVNWSVHNSGVHNSEVLLHGWTTYRLEEDSESVFQRPSAWELGTSHTMACLPPE